MALRKLCLALETFFILTQKKANKDKKQKTNRKKKTPWSLGEIGKLETQAKVLSPGTGISDLHISLTVGLFQICDSAVGCFPQLCWGSLRTNAIFPSDSEPAPQAQALEVAPSRAKSGFWCLPQAFAGRRSNSRNSWVKSPHSVELFI